MDLFDLAARQHGVVSYEQACDRLTRRRLATLERSGAMEHLLPGVYRMRGAVPTWKMRVMAGVLSMPGSQASHRTASVLREVGESVVGRPDLLIERWHRRHRLEGYFVHETKDLVSADLDEVDGIPCTSLVRTLVDLPAVVHPFRAGQALDAAFRRDPSIVQQVVRRHLEVARRGRTGTTALRALLQERGWVGDKVDSGFERLALQLVRRGSLPEPVLQHQVRAANFVAYLDLAWPDRMVGMECDSIAHHLSVAAFERDRVRRRTLLALGWKILEFTYNEVTRHPLMVLRELRRHLEVEPHAGLITTEPA